MAVSRVYAAEKAGGFGGLGWLWQGKGQHGDGAGRGRSSALNTRIHSYVHTRDHLYPFWLFNLIKLPISISFRFPSLGLGCEQLYPMSSLAGALVSPDTNTYLNNANSADIDMHASSFDDVSPDTATGHHPKQEDEMGDLFGEDANIDFVHHSRLVFGRFLECFTQFISQ